jgi:hypothetical protein
VLQLDHIRLDEWLKLLPTAMSLILVMEIFKWWWRRKTGTDNDVVRSEYTEVEQAKEKGENISRPSVA